MTDLRDGLNPRKVPAPPVDGLELALHAGQRRRRSTALGAGVVAMLVAAGVSVPLVSTGHHRAGRVAVTSSPDFPSPDSQASPSVEATSPIAPSPLPSPSPVVVNVPGPVQSDAPSSSPSPSDAAPSVPAGHHYLQPDSEDQAVQEARWLLANLKLPTTVPTAKVTAPQLADLGGTSVSLNFTKQSQVWNSPLSPDAIAAALGLKDQSGLSLEGHSIGAGLQTISWRDRSSFYGDYLVLGYVSVPGGGSQLRAEATVVWQPPRTPQSQIPLPVTSGTLTRSSVQMPSLDVHRTLTVPVANELAKDLNDSPSPTGGGAIAGTACQQQPGDDARITLTLISEGHRWVFTQGVGCGAGESNLTEDGAPKIAGIGDSTFQDLLNRQLAS